MSGLNFRMIGDTQRETIANGYTRLARGLVAYRSGGSTLVVDHPNEVKTEPIGSGRTFNAIVSRALLIPAAPGQGDGRLALAGISLGNAKWIGSIRGANGGWDFYVNGIFLANQQDATTTGLLKLALYEDGKIRAYLNGAFISNTFESPDGTFGTAYDYLQHSSNPFPETVSGSYGKLAVCSSNLIRFARCPANGFVVVTVGVSAPVTVNLDAAGTGSFDCGPLTFPASILYNIQDAAHTTQALLRVNDACGGDTIGLR